MAPTTTTFTAFNAFKATLSTQPVEPKEHHDIRKNKEPSVPPNVETIPFPDQDKDRDALAYEHDRQRWKRARRWAKKLARKAATGDTAVIRPAAHAGRQAKGGKVVLEVDDGYAVTSQGRDTEHTRAKMYDGLGTGILTKVSLPPSEDGRTDAFKADSGVKVNLSELMMLSQRKPRKLNVDDFEMIPHIRSVIALDDVAIVHDMDLMDLDDPWEHIYDNNGEGKASDSVSKFGRLSYARVASTGSQ